MTGARPQHKSDRLSPLAALAVVMTAVGEMCNSSKLLSPLPVFLKKGTRITPCSASNYRAEPHVIQPRPRMLASRVLTDQRVEQRTTEHVEQHTRHNDMDTILA